MYAPQILRSARRSPGVALIAAGLAVLLAGAAFLLLPGLGPEDGGEGGTLRRPIDSGQLTQVAFGERSHWHQTWRAYQDTPPATRLRDAIGINFNVRPEEADATAELLERSGFRRARVEIGWDSVASGEGPARLDDPERIRELVGPLVEHGIRPLILLNAHHGAPGPAESLEAELAAPAAAGAREVRLTRATAREVEPGHTGLDDPEGKAADVLFTKVADDGTASLSKPLPRELDAGPHPATTLAFEPFGPPQLEDGSPNPRFEETLRGWLDYARLVVEETRAVVGSDAFDVEIWNEQTFGADFLRQERYYDPPRETGKGEVTRAILERTVRELRTVSEEIGIGDGFASQTPFPAGSTSPPGLTAIDKHPYYGIRRFPRDATFDAATPLDAGGRPDFRAERAEDGEEVRRDRFVPAYDAFFPEYILTTIQTETLIRDLAPIESEVNGVRHGRDTHSPSGEPPEVWVTEANLDPTGADPSRPGDEGGEPVARMSSRDIEHLHAKAALRYYTAFVNKGVSAMHLYGAKGGGFALISPDFFERAAATGGYPGAQDAGETPAAVGRLSRELADAEPLTETQPLELLAVSDEEGLIQFEGDGTRAHPPLYNRDVVAFLPFQLRPGEWVAAVYVMTRDMATLYDEDAPEDDPSRYDLPEERYRLRIAGLGGEGASASATDPLTGEDVEAKLESGAGRGVTLELPLTDSPRLVRLRQR